MANKNPTVTIDVRTAEALFLEVERMSRALSGLRKKIIKLFPAKYGSDLWWERSVESGIESIKSGRGKKFENYEDAVKYLNS